MDKLTLKTDLKINKLIDDSVISTKSTYSSSKIVQLVGTINNTVNNEYENAQTIDFKFSEEYLPAEVGDRVVYYNAENQVISEYKGEELGWEQIAWDASTLYFDTENSVLYAYNTEAGELIEVTIPNTFVVNNLNTDTRLKTVKTAGTYSVIEHLNSTAHGSYLKNWVMTVTSVDYDDEEYQTGDKWYQVLENNTTIKKRTWSATRQTNDGWSSFSTYYKGEVKDSLTTPSKYYTYSQFKTKELLDTKLDTLTAGDNIEIDENNTISAKGYIYDESLASFAEGQETTASGQASHAEGIGSSTLLSNITSRTERIITFSTLPNNIKIGHIIKDTDGSYAKITNIDISTKVVTVNSNLSTTTDLYLVNGGIAYGESSHTEGWYATASGSYSHAEGSNTTASGISSHAEGLNATASGNYSHAESSGIASGISSHAEGSGTTASGISSHVEGGSATSSGDTSHAEGNNTTASGISSHAEGASTTAQNQAEHAEGFFNLSHKASDTYGNAGNTQHSVGIGTSNRQNAFEIMQNGDVYVLNIGGYQGTDTKVQDTTIKTLQEYIASLETRISNLESRL